MAKNAETTPTIEDLYAACMVLFGPEIDVSVDFIKYLQPSGVKAAYRQRAKETHPDRSVSIGKSEALLNELFKEVSHAYEKLTAVVGNEAYFRIAEVKYNASSSASSFHSARKPPSRTQDRPNPTRPEGARAHGAFLPNRELLFGQFLYYSGHISWEALIGSVVWQKMNRPMVGKLAMELKMISPGQIREILLKRKAGEKFGECAVRLNFISEFNMKALLWRQRKLQQPIGGYFVQKNLLSAAEIESLVLKSKLHNDTVLYRSRKKSFV